MDDSPVSPHSTTASPAASSFLPQVGCTAVDAWEGQRGRVSLVQYWCTCLGSRCGERLHVAPCPWAFPHHVAPSACAADASLRSCVQPCRVPPSLCQCASAWPRGDCGPQVISREVCEVAGLPPQAWRTDSPAACLVPFQTTLNTAH